MAPATLTVELSSQLNETILEIPMPNIEYDNTPSFAELGMTGTYNGASDYSAPANQISRLVSTVTSTGSILNIPAPFPNSSYSMEFYGPSISCGSPSNDSLVKQIANIIANSSWSPNPYAYVGFVPNEGSYDMIKEDPVLMGLRTALNSSKFLGMPSWDQLAITETDTMTFYVVVPSGGYFNDGNKIPNLPPNKTIECGLYNSSYSANFTFENGQQTIGFTTKKLNGIQSNPDLGCSMGSCKSNMAYISLLDALGKLLIGTLATTHYEAIFPTGTGIMNSVLMDTQEMQILRGIQRVRYSAANINYAGWSEYSIANMTMAEALEQVIANATISMFSESAFL